MVTDSSSVTCEAGSAGPAGSGSGSGTQSPT